MFFYSLSLFFTYCSRISSPCLSCLSTLWRQLNAYFLCIFFSCPSFNIIMSPLPGFNSIISDILHYKAKAFWQQPANWMIPLGQEHSLKYNLLPPFEKESLQFSYISEPGLHIKKKCFIKKFANFFLFWQILILTEQMFCLLLKDAWK